MVRCLSVLLLSALAALGLSQTIPPTVITSAEALVIESDRIVIGTAKEAKKAPPSSWGTELKLAVEKTLKGKQAAELNVTVRARSGQDVFGVVGRRVLVATPWHASMIDGGMRGRPESGPTLNLSYFVLELTDPNVTLYGADFRPIKGAAAIERRIRELLRSPPKTHTREFIELEFDRDSAPPGVYYPLLQVPITDSVLQRLKQKLSSPDVQERIMTLQRLGGLEEPILVPEVKNLLSDPHKEAHLPPEYTLGYETSRYPVREAAYRVLKKWKVAMQEPELEERIWKVDALSETQIFNQKIPPQALARLSQAPKLRSLSLQNVELSRAHLIEIGKLRQLKSLRLVNTTFNNEDLEGISSLPWLEEVQATGSSLNDAGLLHLAKLSALKKVVAARTPVTRNGLWAFHRIRPEVEVRIFEPGQTPRPISDNPLHHAAYANDVARAASLLDENPELLNSVDSDNRSALHYAASTDSIEVMKVLLDRGADPNRQSRVGVTPLLWALEFAADRTAMLLVSRKADLELARQDGPWVQLPNGARVPLSYTALTASLLDGRPEAAAVMMQAGANVNRRNELQWTPLMLAVRSKLYRSVQQLIDRGADVNAANVEGNSALHLAALAGDKEMIALLLKNGADSFAKNSAGKRAFDLIAPDK